MNLLFGFGGDTNHDALAELKKDVILQTQTFLMLTRVINSIIMKIWNALVKMDINLETKH
jgi:hypothetical protein